MYNSAPFFKPNTQVIKEITRCFNYDLRNKKILELGAGSGCDIVSLIKMGARGYALDFAQESVKTMKYWSSKENVKLQIIRGDIRKMPFKKHTFDMVYSVGLMEHFEDLLPLLRKQIQIIKPGGFLLIDVPQKYTLYTVAKHIRMRSNSHPFGWETEYSREELIGIAKKLKQQVSRVYGRDSDIIQKFPVKIRPIFNNIYSYIIENTFISPYVSLNIGLIVKIK